MAQTPNDLQRFVEQQHEAGYTAQPVYEAWAVPGLSGLLEAINEAEAAAAQPVPYIPAWAGYDYTRRELYIPVGYSYTRNLVRPASAQATCTLCAAPAVVVYAEDLARRGHAYCTTCGLAWGLPAWAIARVQNGSLKPYPDRAAYTFKVNPLPCTA